jgi:hypothetical protein
MLTQFLKVKIKSYICWYYSDFFPPIGASTGTCSVGENKGKLKQFGNFLPIYRQIISTRRIEIITNKT